MPWVLVLTWTILEVYQLFHSWIYRHYLFCIIEEIVISKFTELTKNRSNTTEGSSVQINEELTSTVKNKHQNIHPRPRSSSWPSPFSNSRSISLSIHQPLSPERSRYNHRDRNNIEVQQATFETSDSTPNNDFSTHTTNYMRDNNTEKKIDIVPSNKNRQEQTGTHQHQNRKHLAVQKTQPPKTPKTPKFYFSHVPKFCTTNVETVDQRIFSSLFHEEFTPLDDPT